MFPKQEHNVWQAEITMNTYAKTFDKMLSTSNRIRFAWAIFITNICFPLGTSVMKETIARFLLHFTQCVSCWIGLDCTYLSNSSTTNLLYICWVGSVTPEILCFRLRNLSIIPAISSLYSV